MEHFDLKPKSALHGYQREGVNHVLTHQDAALFQDCGLGKTVVTLTAVDSLMDRLHSKGALIVAPLRVARLVWPLEGSRWEHLKWMRCRVLHGPKKRERLWGPPGELYSINYEGLMWLVSELNEVPSNEWPFDILVWDELTQMKTDGTARLKAMRPLISKFKRRVGLTGTPSPNSMLELWGQIYVLDGGKRLGTSFSRFRDRFFSRGDGPYAKWHPMENCAEKIVELIGDIALRTAAADHLDLLPPEYIDEELVLPIPFRKMYEKLEKEMFLQLENSEVEVFNAAALSTKCLQFAGGAVYTEKDVWEEVHDVKMRRLHHIVEHANGDPVVVAYGYKHEAERILREFPGAVHLKSGMSAARELDVQDRWDKGLIPLLVCHPASAGHGLNLQFGGHIGVWFTLPWSLLLYLQFNHRIDRQGQTLPPIIHRLIVDNTVEEVVATVLDARTQSQIHLLQVLKQYRETKT